MEYLTVAEAAKKWSLSERSVRNYCSSGRIEGAFQKGKSWFIPEDSSRPGRITGNTEEIYSIQEARPLPIGINTRFITLIGKPLSQSFAARMQNAAFADCGIDMKYFYNEAGSEHLKEILDGIRHMPAFIGAAVTKPNKTAVMEFLDDCEPLCRQMGACNTIVKDESGRLIGYNTDGLGFLKTLTVDAKINPMGKTFYCIGAGGASRPICGMLAHQGAKKVFVTDIYDESALMLVDDINRNFPAVAEAVPYGDLSRIAECEVVINASGVGMGATIGMSPIPAEVMSKDQFYFDACYNPRRTQFLLDAQECGARAMNGLYMSLYQGSKQFELWTGRPAPEDVMRRELIRAVNEIRDEEVPE